MGKQSKVMMSAYFLLLSTLTLVWGAGVNDGQQGGYRDLVCAEDRTVILEVQTGLCPDYVGLSCQQDFAKVPEKAL